MSINLYLKDNEVQKLNGFTVTPRHGNQGEKWNEYSAAGINFSQKGGRWYTYMGEPTDKIPEAIKDLVEKITFQDYLTLSYPRESGLYRHQTAEMECEFIDTDKGRPRYKIKSSGENMEDILVLYRGIKQGNIRPEVSYEVAQGGLSNEELHAKLAEAQRVIKNQEADLDILLENQEALNKANAKLFAQINAITEKLDDVAKSRLWSIRRKARALAHEYAK